MKKIILVVVLMVLLLVTPSLAQEERPENAFSIEGTVWKVSGVGKESIVLIEIEYYLGFYKNEVYISYFNPVADEYWDLRSRHDTSFYMDFLIGSILIELSHSDRPYGFHMGIMSPLGIGFCIEIYYPYYEWSYPRDRWFLRYGSQFLGIMFKVEDNWAPPEEPEVE